MSKEARETFQARKKHKEMEDFLFHLKPDLAEDRQTINELYAVWRVLVIDNKEEG